MVKGKKKLNSKEDFNLNNLKDKNQILEKKMLDDLDKVQIKKNKKKEIVDDEPSWYHYVIIIGVILFLILSIYFGFNYFFSDYYFNGESNLIENSTKMDRYLYPHKIGNITYNIEFNIPVEEIVLLDYPIEVDRYVFFNAINTTFSFLEYEGSDNGFVAITASKFNVFLNRIFHMPFSESSFVLYEERNCTVASDRNLVVIFNPYSDIEGVFYDQNGCIEIKATSAENLIKVGDKLIYSLIT